MARVRVQFWSEWPSVARAQEVRDLLTSADLAGSWYSVVVAPVLKEYDGVPWPVVTGNVCAEVKAEGDDWFTAIVNRFTKGKPSDRALPGSWVSAHDCPDADEAPPYAPCGSLPSYRRTVV